MSNKRNRQKARMPTASNVPLAGLNVISRQIMRAINTGYDESGASTTKGSMRAWQPIGSSPQSDIDANLPILRSRTRSLHMNSPLATSAIGTSRTHVIGAGLRLRSRIDAAILGLNPEEAKVWQKRTEKEFNVWAMSKFCDLLKRNSFYDMQDIAYVGFLLNGDSWVALKYRIPIPGMPYMLRMQLLEADRISNPDTTTLGGLSPFTVWTTNRENGNRIVNGVEIDGDGAVVAYWISNRHPYDPTNLAGLPSWARVEAFGKKAGAPNIIQICHDERAEQYRGIPYLAPVIEAFKQITRYTEAELTAAIVKAFFTLFFKQQAGAPGGMFPVSEPIEPGDKVSLDANDFELGPGSMNVLPPGYEVQQVDASRSLSTFEAFTTSLIKQIAAALEQPYEVLMKAFNSSYSASRAAMLQAWSAYKMRRDWFARDFCQPVFETWLTEAVAIGRIQAPGFFDDPLIKAAWCGAEWYGPVMGVLDPVKEATGAALRIQNGLSTGEKEAAEMTGTDFDENIQQRAMEIKALTEAGIMFQPINSITINEKGGNANNE